MQLLGKILLVFPTWTSSVVHVVSALLLFLSSDNQRSHYKLLQSGDAEELVW